MTAEVLHVDREALRIGLACFGAWLASHRTVRCIDAHRERGFVHVDFAGGETWAFAVGDTDPDEAAQAFEVYAAEMGAFAP